MSEKKNIIGLVGQIACGKGTAALYLKNNHNANIYRFSTMLRDVLDRLYLEITRSNMQSISECLRQKFGGDILAKVIAEDVQKDPGKLIVVDGVRRMDDIKYLQKLPGFNLVKIETGSKIRYNRLITRTENKDDGRKTYEEFLSDEQREAEREIPKVMAGTKLSLNNDGDLENLYKQIGEILKNLGYET